MKEDDVDSQKEYLPMQSLSGNAVWHPREKNSDSITVADILDDLRQSTKTDEVEGMTALQFAQSLEIGEKKAAKILKKLVQSGQMKCVRKQIVDVTGRVNFTFVYTTK